MKSELKERRGGDGQRLSNKKMIQFYLLWEEGVVWTTMIAHLGPKSCMVNIYHMFIYWQEHYHIILSDVYVLTFTFLWCILLFGCL